MKRFEIRYGLALAVLVLCVWRSVVNPRTTVGLSQEGAAAAAVTPFQQEIEEDLAKLPRSLAAADQEALLARYLPDPPPTLFYPGPAPEQFQVRGWSGTKNFWATYFKIHRHVQLHFNSAPDISLLGGAAVARNTFSCESTQVSDAKRVYGYGRITVVYKKVDDHPYVIHEHLSFLAAQPAGGGRP